MSAWGDANSDDDDDFFLNIAQSKSISQDTKKNYAKQFISRKESSPAFTRDSRDSHDSRDSRDAREAHRDLICNPTSKSKNHVIYKTDNVIFQLDMMKRPIIIASPIKHLNNIFQVDTIFWKDIEKFINEWNISNYTITVSSENENEHLNMKIKCPENFVKRVRDTHFKKLQKEKIYSR